jgi:hypothetical protein
MFIVNRVSLCIITTPYTSVSGELHAPTSLPPGVKIPPYPLIAILCGLDFMSKKKDRIPTADRTPNFTPLANHLYHHHHHHQEYIKFGEFLLLFSPKSFVFPSHIKKPKD